MTRKTTTHIFEDEELEELKNETDEATTEEALKKWARHNYPIGAGAYTIGTINSENGKIEIIEY